MQTNISQKAVFSRADALADVQIEVTRDSNKLNVTFSVPSCIIRSRQLFLTLVRSAVDATWDSLYHTMFGHEALKDAKYLDRMFEDDFMKVVPKEVVPYDE